MSTIGESRGQPTPQEHVALEAEIRRLQESHENTLDEEVLQALVSRVATRVIPQLGMAAGLRPALRTESLAVAARMITLLQDKQGGKEGTPQEVTRVIQELGTTATSQEALLRVIHAISSLALQHIPVIPNAPLQEIHQATTLLAAQQLKSELTEVKKQR